MVVDLRVRELRLAKPRDDVWTARLIHINVLHILQVDLVCHFIVIWLNLMLKFVIWRTSVEVCVAAKQGLCFFDRFHFVWNRLLRLRWRLILNSFANVGDHVEFFLGFPVFFYKST